MDWAPRVYQWTVQLATAYLVSCPAAPPCPSLVCPGIPTCPACPGAPRVADEPRPANGSSDLALVLLLAAAFCGGGAVACLCHWWQDRGASDLTVEARRQFAVIKGRRGA